MQHPSLPPPPFGIVEPVPVDLARTLRRAVLEHATTERRRVFGTVIHVGRPGREQRSLALTGLDLDHALRTDLVEAMVPRPARGDTPSDLLVWLTRPPDPCLQDEDLAWAAATRAAAAELERALPMVVVDRRGWRDPHTGVHRTWRRLRSPS